MKTLFQKFRVKKQTGAILSFLYLATPEGRHEYRIRFPDSCTGDNMELENSDYSIKLIPKLEELLKFVTSESYKVISENPYCIVQTPSTIIVKLYFL